jgi:DNA-binding MarR family transcriptional regulator
MMLRTARRTYAAAIRKELLAGGLGDLPLNGPWVVRAIKLANTPLSDIARELSVSKQAASKLIDLLVVRGFLERTADPVDRRRITLALTERGHLAAKAVDKATNRVDADLKKALSATQMAGFRAGLDALIDLSQRYASLEDDNVAANGTAPIPKRRR